MRYLALATDYDGTLAHHGTVAPEMVEALERLKASGRRLILVTGRVLDDLFGVFPEVAVFDRVVAENGALVHDPSSKETRLLADGPPKGFAEELEKRGVGPISVGNVIVATWEPHEATVLETIREMGLELQVIFNKGAVMVLPSGINKATGLIDVLSELGLSRHNVAGVGDAENDHAFLDLCECSVAVGNALPSLQERCDHVTRGRHGDGVSELVEALLEDDLAGIVPRRHRVPIGSADEREVWIEPYGTHMLVAGPSGSGKSSLTTTFLERLVDARYQFCLIDPEGDYQELAGAIVLGDPERAPSVAEVLQVLEKPEENVVVNLLGIQLEDRPGFFDALVPRLQELRAQLGRPHWIVIDEAHHLLPAERGPTDMTLPRVLAGTMMVTVHPERTWREALEPVDVCIAIGKDATSTFRGFAKAVGDEPPDGIPASVETGEAVAWFRRAREAVHFEVAPPRTELRRHRRKYMKGDIEEKAFHFRGPEGKLNIRAQNLALFMQIGDGLDEATWLHHLRNGDYARWFRDDIKDESLAQAAERLADEDELSLDDARRRLREAIEARYTLPA